MPDCPILQASQQAQGRTCGTAAHHHKVQRCLHVLFTGAWQGRQLKLVLDALAQAHAVGDLRKSRASCKLAAA